jgi:dTDP-4-amino-4,6-dideoxygalactose transaminase
MVNQLSIAQADPGAGYLQLQSAIDAAIQRVLLSGHYILGEEIENFEKEFAEYLGVQYAVGVASGTDALALTLRAYGIGAGDDVITVSHTAVATVAAIELTGARPILVDIEPGSFTMDPYSLESCLVRLQNNPSFLPRAIIPVHLYGNMADMPSILEIAKKNNLVVIEDCAQAHGSSYQGRMAGSWGSAGTFSFYPTKNLGAIGDGGALVTNDSAIANRVRLLRQYGWQSRYISEIPGINSRLDALQAAILRVKLSNLDMGNNQRRLLADLYIRNLIKYALELPTSAPDVVHTYHQFVIRTQFRDQLRGDLNSLGIQTNIHYPVPVHRQPAYQNRLIIAGSMVETELAAQQVLSLPMYPELHPEQVLRVADAINKLLLSY